MAAPTPEELELIPKFRERIQDLNLNEKHLTAMQLLRWLRGKYDLLKRIRKFKRKRYSILHKARDLNVDKADEMIREAQTYNDKFGENILSHKPPSWFLDDFPYEITGLNKNGSPVLVVPFGDWNFKRMVDEGLKDEYVKYFFQMCHQAIQEIDGKTDSEGIEKTRFTIISDQENFAFRNLASKDFVAGIIEQCKHIELNFPERLDSIFVINAPYFFPIFFNIFKPVLGVRTLNKLQIFDSNKAVWLEALKKDMPDDTIPGFYGGTNKKIIRNSKGEKNVKSKLKLGKKSSDGLLKIQIPAGKNMEIEFEIAYQNSTLAWEVKAEAFDIGFSVIFNRESEFYQYKTVAAGEIEKETRICDKPGKYILHFDNTYSRMRPKVIFYDVLITVPEEAVEPLKF